jgi:hypothetical protein
MLPRDAIHDRQPEARASLIPRTAPVRTRETLEDTHAICLRNARPVVVDA